MMNQLFLCLFSSAMAATLTNSALAASIKIGEVGSMTGAQATFGVSTHQGIELAIKEQNAKGGIRGNKIELISLDDQGKPEEAATATTKLITQDKVTAIIGEVASSLSLAMAPIAQQNKIPMVSPSSTNPKVTDVGNYIFRVCFIDPFQGSVMAKFAFENLKSRRVAILRDMKSDYSVGLSDFFAASFKKMGGEIIVDQSYSAGDVDFNAQLTSIKAKKPDAIFVPGYYTEVGLIAKQARQLGVKVPLMGGDGWDSEKLPEIGGKSLNNSFFSNHYSQEDKSPAVQSFIANYKADYKKIPDGLAALGYDAAKVLFVAMEKTKSVAPAEIRDELAKIKDYQAVTGKITIDEKRNATKSAVVLEVLDRKFVYKTVVNP
ncbi:MAG: ABC transporter substrate-binding protein [Proteobacteria bacterium]|nr:ABC transporter substrate-binding protein [Pseudomonadota bacterium]